MSKQLIGFATAFALSAALALPLAASAASCAPGDLFNSMTGQRCPTPPPTTTCVDLARNLTLGSTGSDVVALQGHLATKGLFTYTGARGYYGFITAQAVGQLQVSLGIVSSASDNAYGLMGPRTRAAIACGTTPPNTTFSASPTYGTAPLAVTFNWRGTRPSSVDYGDGKTDEFTYCLSTGVECNPTSGSFSHTYTSAGTYTAKLVKKLISAGTIYPAEITYETLGTVTITVGNGSTTGAPSISGIDGPTQLAVGQSGSWTVRVNDASGYLSYSVRWGDEATRAYANGTISSLPISSSGTFTHTYANAGLYSPTFTVTNRNGQSASASAGVVVGSSVQASTLTATPTSGTAPLAVSFSGSGVTGGSQYVIEYGDSANSGSVTAVNLCTMTNIPGGGGCPQVSSTHTYTSPGTYTATLSPYVACLYTNSITRCMAPAVILGSVTVTVQ